MADSLENQIPVQGQQPKAVLNRQPSSVNQLRKLFDHNDVVAGAPGSITGTGGSLRPRRPTMDNLNPVRKRQTGSISVGTDDEEYCGSEEVASATPPTNRRISPLTNRGPVSSPGSYGVRNYGASPQHYRPRMQTGYDDEDERRRRFDQELYEFEEQKKTFNNNFSRFLQKKEDFLDKVE